MDLKNAPTMEKIWIYDGETIGNRGAIASELLDLNIRSVPRKLIVPTRLWYRYEADVKDTTTRTGQRSECGRHIVIHSKVYGPLTWEVGSTVRCHKSRFGNEEHVSIDGNMKKIKDGHVAPWSDRAILNSSI